LGGQLAGVVHFALVQHARCAEHGELVHADQLSANASDAISQRRPLSSSAYESDARAATEHAQHDHCAGTSERRGYAVLLSRLVVRVPQVQRAREFHARDVFDPLARERWLLAPKSSPPA
jgi:hypothetical protein